MLHNCLLIAGTDTDVGKTAVGSALIAYCRRFLSNTSLGVIKLMQTGIGDRQWYEQFCDEAVTLRVPLEFDMPVAPPIAAAQEERKIDLGLVWQSLQELRESQDFVIAESLGSLGSPVTDELTVADLAGQWKLPTVMVVPVKLGSIGQTIAQVSLAREKQVDLRGLILSCTTPEAETQIEALAEPEMLKTFTHLPVLGVLPYMAALNDHQALGQIVADWQLDPLIPMQYLLPKIPLSP